MTKGGTIKEEGIVLESLTDLNFKVRLKDGTEVIAYLSGRMRHFHIKIIPGDKVTVEMSPYDRKRGRIIWRGK